MALILPRAHFEAQAAAAKPREPLSSPAIRAASPRLAAREAGSPNGADLAP